MELKKALKSPAKNRPRSLSFEHISPGEKSSFAFKNFSQPCFGFKWHFHPELELTLIVKGRGLRYVGDSIEPYGPGDLCFLGADLPHSWESRPENGPVESIVIQFRKEIFESVLENTPELKLIGKFLEESRKGFRFTGATRSQMEALMLSMRPDKMGPPLRFAKLLEALVLLSESREKKNLALALPTDSVTGAEKNIREVMRLIHQSLTTGVEENSLTQDEIAGRAGMSTAFFSRWFKKTVGKNFITYLTEVRVARACQSLIQTEKKIVEIALEAGFHSLANFNRQFKAVKNETPKSYRLRSQKGS